jgi:hypothetical protein
MNGKTLSTPLKGGKICGQALDPFRKESLGRGAAGRFGQEPAGLRGKKNLTPFLQSIKLLMPDVD